MLKPKTYLSQYFINLGGHPARREFMDDVIEVVVEDNLYLPDMFSLVVYDQNFKWTNSEVVAIGQAVEILAQAPQPQTQELGPKARLLAGEITGLEPQIEQTGVPTLTIRGYDRSYRLHQGRQTRSFLKSTDSEIAQRIAEESRLSTDQIKTTTTIHEHVVQHNQTNMAFLLDRARRLGFDLFVEGESLYFGPPPADQSQPAKLSWGRNLLSFRPRLSVVHQVDEVEVRSWDPLTKREIVAHAVEAESVPKVPGQTKTNDRFLGANRVVVSRPLANQAEAEALAQGLRDEIGGRLIQAEGVCLGNPGLGAGTLVEIEGLGRQFDGAYFVTASSHAFRAGELYKTMFTIGGREPQTLSSLLSQDRSGYSFDRGVVVGLVTNNKDPNGLGRIKVKYPGMDELDESPWVRLAAPMAGQQRGFYALPEINDEVLIAFEQGDIHRPYMVGMLWNGADHPPKPNHEVVSGDGRVNQRLIRSRSGHQIILDDTNGAEKVIIADKHGNEITMADGSMSIKVKGDLAIEASGNVSIKGKAIDLN
jgi:phage protein D